MIAFTILGAEFIEDPGAIEGLALPGGMVYEWVAGKAEEVKSTASFLAPRDTGRLASSIEVSTGSEGGTVVFNIGTDVEYAIFQELGTIHHDAHPFLRPALAAIFGSFGGYVGA